MPSLPSSVKADTDTIVVGAGILGATIAKALRREGRTVTLFDDKRPMGGTTPSGGHLKPSWFGDLKKADYEPAMELLDQIWGMTSSEFVIKPTNLKTTVYRIDTDVVVNEPFTNGKVLRIISKASHPTIELATGESISCRLLIVAAGVWCSELFPGIKIVEKQGVSFRAKGVLESEFIKPWAPFKQVVAHQQSKDEIWVGDGSAILRANWTLTRTTQCRGRCQSSIGSDKPINQVKFGLRPYCEHGSAPCLLEEVFPKIWVVTGAGKSGTISAGWASNKIISATN